MEETENGYRRSDLNEVLASLRRLVESVELRHSQSERMGESLHDDLARLRQDQRDLEEKLDCVICVVQHQIDALGASAAAQGRSVYDIMAAIEELRRPVAEIAALRSRVAGGVVCLGVVGSMVLWLAEPVYRWLIEAYLRH